MQQEKNENECSSFGWAKGGDWQEHDGGAPLPMADDAEADSSATRLRRPAIILYMDECDRGAARHRSPGYVDDILDRVPVAATRYDYVVIDGPAGLSELTRTILLRADLALVPCKPTGVDVRSAADSVRLIKQAQSVRGGLPQAALFLSMALKRTNLKSESLEVLSGLGLSVLAATIHQKQAVADAFGQKSTVFDMGGKAGAESAREFKALFEEAIAL